MTLGADAVQFDDRTASALATPSYRLQAINANGESAFTATVTPPNLRPIEQWRFEYFGTTQNTGEAADEYVAGGDGLTNFVKYALGLEPRVPVRSFTTGSLPGRPRTEVNAESASLVYVRPVDRPDIRYGVRASSDLKAWTAVPDVSEGTADGMERRRATVPKAGLVAQSGHRLGTCRSGQRIRAGIPSPNHFAVAAGQPDPPEPLRRPSQGPRRKRLGRRDRTARRSDPSCRYQCRRRNRVRICGHQNNRETHGLRLHLRRNSRALEADSAKVKAVFLFGHIPIVHSGFYNVDGHRTRSMPADAFYGDMDGNWKDSDGDGVLDPSTLPSDVELEVGRVDLAAMPGNLTTNGPASFPSERELLRQYLHKDHEFRHARVPVPRRALIGDRFGRYDGEAFAAGGYRTFAAFFGATNIVKANADDGAPVEERWISLLGRNAYLWAFGSGGGNYTSLRALGTHPPYDSVVTTDLVSVDAKAVFTMVFGSKLVEWDTEDNIMRAVLATPTFGLACSWSGRPHLFYHHMGLGETIGYGIRLRLQPQPRCVRNPHRGPRPTQDHSLGGNFPWQHSDRLVQQTGPALSGIVQSPVGRREMERSERRSGSDRPNHHLDRYHGRRNVRALIRNLDNELTNLSRRIAGLHGTSQRQVLTNQLYGFNHTVVVCCESLCRDDFRWHRQGDCAGAVSLVSVFSEFDSQPKSNSNFAEP